MKAGIKSTEFWVMAVVTIVGLVMAALPENDIVLKVGGLIMSVVGSLGYTITRGSVKKAVASNPRPEE